MIHRSFIIVLALFTAFGCTAPKLIPGAPPQEMEYRVQAPDMLTISVSPAPEIQREVTVRPDGRISFDLIGDVDVAGHTVEEIRKVITKRVKKYIVHPNVVVLLAVSASRMYYVFGEVSSPGSYPLVGAVTAAQALAAAGGPNRLAALGRGRLTRPTTEGNEAYHVNFDSIINNGNGTTNFILQPGDVIYVPPSVSGSIGYGLGNIFFPIQQIFGLGGGAARVIAGGA